jgi:hypothetical protein
VATGTGAAETIGAVVGVDGTIGTGTMDTGNTGRAVGGTGTGTELGVLLAGDKGQNILGGSPKSDFVLMGAREREKTRNKEQP